MCAKASDAPHTGTENVLNHVGFAIRRIPLADVHCTIALYEQLLQESARGDGGDLMAADVRGEIEAGRAGKAGGQERQEGGEAGGCDRPARVPRSRPPPRPHGGARTHDPADRPVDGLDHARLRQPRAGDREVWAAIDVPARSQRHHGPGLPRLHGSAGDRRGGSRSRSRGSASPPTPTCFAWRAAPARWRTRNPAARASTWSTALRRRWTSPAKRPARLCFSPPVSRRRPSPLPPCAGWRAGELLGAFRPQMHSAGDGNIRGHIMPGIASPADCPLFGGACVPDPPVGACIVSREGTCRIWHQYGGAPNLGGMSCPV